MTEFGEEETIQEILESHGITGSKEQRLRKHFQDWIRGRTSGIQYSVYADNPRCREAIQKALDVLLCEVPSNAGGAA